MLTQSYLLNDHRFQTLVACTLLETVIGIRADTAEALLKQVGGIHKLAQTSGTDPARPASDHPATASN